jgi:hypothetical protein
MAGDSLVLENIHIYEYVECLPGGHTEAVLRCSRRRERIQTGRKPAKNRKKLNYDINTKILPQRTKNSYKSSSARVASKRLTIIAHLNPRTALKS